MAVSASLSSPIPHPAQIKAVCNAVQINMYNNILFIKIKYNFVPIKTTWGILL